MLRRCVLVALLLPLATACATGPDLSGGFPAAWFGVWEGRSLNLAPGKAPGGFATRLEIAPTEQEGTVHWRIVYGSGDNEQVRDYLLVAVDGEKGHYVVDEQNSIRLDHYFVGAAMHTFFRVNDALLHVRYELVEADRMVVEMVSANHAAPQATGGEGDAPSVTVWPVRVVQHGELVRR